MQARRGHSPLAQAQNAGQHWLPVAGGSSKPGNPQEPCIDVVLHRLSQCTGRPRWKHAATLSWWKMASSAALSSDVSLTWKALTFSVKYFSLFVPEQVAQAS